MKCCICRNQVTHQWWTIEISNLLVQTGPGIQHKLFMCSEDCAHKIHMILSTHITQDNVTATIRQLLNNQHEQHVHDKPTVEDPFHDSL